MNPTRLVSSLFLIRGAWKLAVPLALATWWRSCGEAQKQGGPPPPAVTVAKPIKRTLFDYDEYVGRFTAINAVEVRARVSGYLDFISKMGNSLSRATCYSPSTNALSRTRSIRRALI